MGAQAQARPMSSRPPNAKYKRSFRNLLLQPRFQLKYTAMVVGVTVVVAAVLGAFAYRYSRGQTEMLTIQKMESAFSAGETVSPTFTADLERYAEEADRNVLLAIIGSILLLAVALGLTGIVVTHKLVGPAFRLKNLLRQVRDGHLHAKGRLREGDELHDIFDAFQEMTASLREAQRQEIALLEAAIARAEEADVPAEALSDVHEVLRRMRAALE